MMVVMRMTEIGKERFFPDFYFFFFSRNVSICGVAVFFLFFFFFCTSHEARVPCNDDEVLKT